MSSEPIKPEDICNLEIQQEGVEMPGCVLGALFLVLAVVACVLYLIAAWLIAWVIA